MKKLKRVQLKSFFGGSEIYHCKCDNGKTVTAVVRDSMSAIEQIDQACGGVSSSCVRG